MVTKEVNCKRCGASFHAVRASRKFCDDCRVVNESEKIERYLNRNKERILLFHRRRSILKSVARGVFYSEHSKYATDLDHLVAEGKLEKREVKIFQYFLKEENRDRGNMQ